MADPVRKPPPPESQISSPLRRTISQRQLETPPSTAPPSSAPSLKRVKIVPVPTEPYSSQSGEESEEPPPPSQARKRLNFEVEKDSEKNVRSRTDSMSTTGLPSESQYESEPSEISSPRRLSKTSTTTGSASGETMSKSIVMLPRSCSCLFLYQCVCQTLLSSPTWVLSAPDRFLRNPFDYPRYFLLPTASTTLC